MKKLMVVAAVAAAGAVLAAGLGPQNYVQDGLVTHFDAIDNEGTGTHNPSATTWRDLKGSAYITLLTGASWTNRYFDSTATMHTIKTMPGYDRTSLTMEAPVNVISNGASGNYPRIFSNGESFSIYFSGTGTSPALYFNGQSPDTRPNFASFRIGTVYAFGSSTSYGIGLNGVQRSATSVPVKVAITKPAADWTLNGSGGGYLHGHYYGLRFYNRSLSQAELRANAEVDGLRFFSYTYTGTGAAVNWSAIPWIKPEGQTATVPSTDKTAYAQVVNATVNVAASDNVKLAGLSLEDGATLNVPSGAEAFLDVLYVEGQAVQTGRYTGTGSVGTQVSWISGAGVVHVGDDGFLQSTGNQAINTGYFVKPSTRIVVDYEFTSATPTQQRVFGAASDDASAGLSCAHYINGNGKYAWALQDGNGNWQSLDVTATTDRRTLDLDSYKSQVQLLTGGIVTKSSTFSTKRTNTAVWPLAIFANCTGAAGTTFNNYGKVKLYSFAIYEEGVLKHAYLPYRSADETVVGLKDMMTGDILEKAVGSAFSSANNNNSDPVWRLDDYRCYTGTGATENWSDIAWSMPFGRATVPAASSFSLTNMCVDISNAKVNVAASDKLGLWQLSLTNGATLNVASDAIVAVKTVFVEGVAVPRGIYTGTGSVGTQASWLEGDGVVRVAGARNAEIPDTIPTPAGDGWYEFGITSANGGRTWRPNNWYIVADWPKWDRILFPAGARVRFVGYTILDTIPSGVFSEVDFTQAEYILLHGKQVFADGSPFTIPSGVTLRYQPGNWVLQSNPDEYKLTTDGSGTMTTPLNIVGTLYVYGDGTHLARQEYSGILTGNGELKFGNFGNQARFTGGFAFNGKVTGYQNGHLLWVDSLAVTSSISGVTFSDCGNTYQTNSAHRQAQQRRDGRPRVLHRVRLRQCARHHGQAEQALAVWRRVGHLGRQHDACRQCEACRPRGGTPAGSGMRHRLVQRRHGQGDRQSRGGRVLGRRQPLPLHERQREGGQGDRVHVLQLFLPLECRQRHDARHHELLPVHGHGECFRHRDVARAALGLRGYHYAHGHGDEELHDADRLHARHELPLQHGWLHRLGHARERARERHDQRHVPDDGRCAREGRVRACAVHVRRRPARGLDGDTERPVRRLRHRLRHEGGSAEGRNGSLAQGAQTRSRAHHSVRP